jgi:hypothetical protein
VVIPVLWIVDSGRRLPEPHGCIAKQAAKDLGVLNTASVLPPGWSSSAGSAANTSRIAHPGIVQRQDDWHTVGAWLAGPTML